MGEKLSRNNSKMAALQKKKKNSDQHGCQLTKPETWSTLRSLQADQQVGRCLFQVNQLVFASFRQLGWSLPLPWSSAGLRVIIACIFLGRERPPESGLFQGFPEAE